MALIVMIALVPAVALPMLTTSAANPTLSTVGVIQPGVVARVVGAGFPRNTPLLVWWDGFQLAPARSNQNGAFDVAVTVPAGAAAGSHVLAASYAAGAPDGSGAPPRGNGKTKPNAQPSAPTMVVSITVAVVNPATPAPAAAAPTVAPPTPAPTVLASPLTVATPSPSVAPTVVATATPAATQSPGTATPAPTTAPPSASEFVVSTGGSDTNPGTAAAPWRTLQHAASTVSAGATVLVRAGTHAGFRMTRSGTEAGPITFASYPGETAVISGSASTVNVIALAGVHDIVLRGLIVQGAAADKSGAGIRVDGASYRIRVESNVLRENRSYGISIVDSTYVTVRNNEITGNAEGVYVLRAGTGVVIANNSIHHQDRLVVATAGGGDDHGAVGVAFVRTSGPVLATGNRLWGNRAPSPDYGYDGGAFEIYAASHVTITGNTMWDNRNILETGSDGAACSSNRFTRNVAYGATTVDVSKGMVLRCAEGMLVANNTFYRLDMFVFDIQTGGNFGTSVSGLNLLNNVAVMRTGKVYGIVSGLAPLVRADYNVVYQESGGTLGSYGSFGSTSSFGTFRSWTGFDLHGMNADPSFIQASTLDFRLAVNSPAIDRAISLSGVTDGVMGAAPDIGRHESH